MTVRITSKGSLAKHVQELAQLGAVTLGVQGREASATHTPDPKAQPKGPQPRQSIQTIGEIAERHELGLGVPERSWLRAWVDAHEGMIRADAGKAMRRVLEGKLTREQALEILALKWQGAIQQWIADGRVQPPLSQVTIDRKGSSVPLIDTGQLRSAITGVARAVVAAGGVR